MGFGVFVELLHLRLRPRHDPTLHLTSIEDPGACFQRGL
jgi:hypothetical protein